MLRFLVSIACLAILVAGCSEKQIEVQTVPVGQSSYDVFRVKQPSDQKAERPSLEVSKKVARRMIVAMFEQPDKTWFFKANGNEDTINDQQKQILELFRGVTFEQDEPKWKLPEGWTVGPKKTSMFAPLATLIIDADSDAQLTISSLGPNQELLANANRWRAQLGLESLTQDQIDTQFAKGDGDDFYLFDAVGTGTGQMAGGKRPPFANAPFRERGPMQSGGGSASPNRSRPPAAGSGLKYKSPAGWAENQSSGMVPATRFTKKSDSDPSKPTLITLTRMSSAVNNWPANVERWAGQAGQSFTDEEITAATEELTINGQPSQLIELLDGDPDMAIVAVMTVAGDDAWFFKLIGDKESVTKEQPAFRKLLDSIKFN